MRIISDFSERYFCHFYHFFSKKVEKMVCLESVGKLLFLPLLPVLHNLFQCGKSGSQFCHFYQQKVWKKSETVGEVVKVAKISSKKVALGPRGSQSNAIDVRLAVGTRWQKKKHFRYRESWKILSRLLKIETKINWI